MFCKHLEYKFLLFETEGLYVDTIENDVIHVSGSDTSEKAMKSAFKVL